MCSRSAQGTARRGNRWQADRSDPGPAAQALAENPRIELWRRAGQHASALRLPAVRGLALRAAAAGPADTDPCPDARRQTTETGCARPSGRWWTRSTGHGSAAFPCCRRLTEIILIEILRHQITTAAPRRSGWLAALADPALSRCLSLIHAEPGHEWSLEELAAVSGMSRSVLAERFQAILGTSPIRYVRHWRLYLASVALATTGQAIAHIGFEAGYATEAAFSRAFSRAFGSPPATWRARTEA